MKQKSPHDWEALGIAFLFALLGCSLLWSLYWLWVLTISMPRGLWID